MIKSKSLIKLCGLMLAGGLAIAANKIVKTSDNKALAQGKPKVVASHNIICNLLDTVARDTIDLTCLIDGDRDPHTYRPTPRDLKAIESAQLIIYGGYQLEPQLLDLLATPEDEGENAVPTIALYEQAIAKPLMVEAEHGHEHEHEHEKPEKETQSSSQLEPDPHVWHNVENTVAMVDYLQSLFLQLNPNAAEQYLTNSTQLTEQLWQLDAWIKNRVDTIPEGQRVLVTTHDSLNYYAGAYYFDDYKALQGLSGEAAPTASQVKKLVTEIKQTEVPTIFAESTASDRVINNVARAAGVELAEEKLYVDGLGTADSYSQMMSYNTCAIVNGLGGKCEPFKAE